MARRKRKLSQRERKQVAAFLDSLRNHCFLGDPDHPEAVVNDQLRVLGEYISQRFHDDPQLRILLDHMAWDELTREFLRDARKLQLAIALEVAEKLVSDY
jgi:hypothetical protein